MQKVIITGASGFIGHRLINRLTGDAGILTNAVCHKKSGGWSDKGHLNIHQRDLSYLDSWEGLIEHDCVVVNLVYFWNLPASENILAARRLIDTCRRKGVKKLIHCSSATVAGSVKEDIVTEETPCQPSTEYEKTKWQIEQTLLETDYVMPEIIILRPTAVFGPGGKNLVKLVNELRYCSKLYNYIKSCLYQRRSMNLVSVETVADSIKYFIKAPQAYDHEVFIVSDDEYPENNFIDVERQLRNALGIPDYRLKRIDLPLMTLATLLRLTRKTNINLLRRYSCEKLLRCGFRKKSTFIENLKAYAKDLNRSKAAVTF
jgi:nucleoside-diphosphate-sugar epimerase